MNGIPAFRGLPGCGGRKAWWCPMEFMESYLPWTLAWQTFDPDAGAWDRLVIDPYGDDNYSPRDKRWEKRLAGCRWANGSPGYYYPEPINRGRQAYLAAVVAMLGPNVRGSA